MVAQIWVDSWMHCFFRVVSTVVLLSVTQDITDIKMIITDIPFSFYIYATSAVVSTLMLLVLILFPCRF